MELRPAEVEAMKQQSILLDNINHVVNGQPTSSIHASVSRNDTNVHVGTTVGYDSPLSGSSKLSVYEKMKKVSPTAAMAEASLLSQKAAVKEAENLNKLIGMQVQELHFRQE